MLVQILTHTPKWVFILFLVLLMLGYQQTRSRQVRKDVVFFFPVGMIVLSCLGIYSSFGVKLFSLIPWGLGIAVLIIVGVKIFPIKGIYVSSSQDAYFIPGSWIPFFVIMAIFFTKYTVGVLIGMQNPIVSNGHFILVVSFMFGCFSGYFLSRAICIWQSSANFFQPTDQ